jgi:predicted DNA-binding transcriptional regulator AlpA
MQRSDARYQMDRDPDLIVFDRLADMLGVSQGELARMIERPEFPRRVHNDRRGYWRRADVQAWLNRARAHQQMTRPNPTGPRAA